MLEKIQGIIFDLDGTLVDSMWIWKDIDIAYLDRFGISLPENLQHAIEGMSYTETASYFKETFGLTCSLEEIKQSWHEMAYGKYAHEVPMKPGALTFLQEMKSRGIQMGIATSNGRRLVEAVVRAHHLDAYITNITTACDVAKGKPAPDIYLKVARELQLAPESCLVFEDVPMGILAGKNAGMRVCAVEDLFSEEQRDTKRRLADYYIRTYDEILDNLYEVITDEK